MQLAMAAARRAVELAPCSHVLRWLLARVHFLEGDIGGFLSEGDKALELNSIEATAPGPVPGRDPRDVRALERPWRAPGFAARGARQCGAGSGRALSSW